MKKIASEIFAVLMLVGLAACGGGSGSSPPSAASTLGAIAAVGYPIVSGTVQVKCASGPSLSTITSSTGAWQVTLSGGQTPPCAVEVSGGTINNITNNTSYHSMATAAGTVNVTPLTDLMVALLTGQDPSIWFAGLNTPAMAAITQANVDTALANLRTALSGLVPLSTMNPITTSFTPTPGNTYDDMLAALQAAIANIGSTYATVLNAASTNSFTTAVAALNAALPAAYAGTPSGSAGSDPGITGVFPTSEAPGASVTISGTNFRQGTGGITSGNAYRVSFNGTNVTPYLRTLMQLAVIVPTGATSGTLTVTDLITNQVYTVPGDFTVTGSTGGGTGTPGTQMGGALQGAPLNLTATVTTLAGSGTVGAVDSTGTAASFNLPIGITTDGTNLYVMDTFNHKVRKIVIATGVVTTLAGSGVWGAVDGTGTAASFSYPADITTDGTSLYVADYLNQKIRKIVIATGVVTTLAGSGTIGAIDGTGTAASFNLPIGITTDGTNLYVTDYLNEKVRKIVIATGVVTTLAGSGTAGAVDGTGTSASFSGSRGITTDGTSLYVADVGNNKVRKIVIATGVVTTLAGSGSVGAVDGTGTAASFDSPISITTDGTNLYVADVGNNKIRKIVIATGVVSTLAGSGTVGAVDGTGTAASFNLPRGVTTDGTSLYVADYGNHKVRKIQ